MSLDPFQNCYFQEIQISSPKYGILEITQQQILLLASYHAPSSIIFNLQRCFIQEFQFNLS